MSRDIITYADIVKAVGTARANDVANDILAIHGGCGLSDLKAMPCGITLRGMGEADISQIEALLKAPSGGDAKKDK